MAMQILSWAGYVAAFAILVSLPNQIKRWRAVKRLYGYIPYRLGWQIGVYSKKNRMLRFQLRILFIMLLFFLIPGLINWLGSNIFDFFHPFDDKARSQLIFVLLISVWMIMRVVNFLLPPTALILGTAKSVNIHLVAILNQSLELYRIVSLFDLKKEHIFPLFASDVMYNNLRTVNDYEWRTVIHHLMDVVPLIIVDNAVSTEYVDEEMNRIKKFDYGYKVISFSSAAYGWEINTMQSEIWSVISASNQLGKELVPEIQDYIITPIDTKKRMKAQEYYNSMIKIVPRLVRFNSDINAMLIKANYILAWTMENYIKDCKQNIQGAYSTWLLEDIPLRVDTMEDEVYLRQSRGLDEIRGIAYSALDLALKTPGPQQSFNIANAHSRIGKFVRFSKEWDVAIDHLTKAIEMFSKMSDGINAQPMNLSQIQTELADAYFILGEVYMARFRKTASVSDRDTAELNFKGSIYIDEKLGQDFSEALCRIKSLQE